MIAQCSLISIIITIAIIQLIQCSDELFPSHLEPYQSVRFSLFQSTKKSTLLGLQHNKKSVNRIGRH